jgi:hypothetical protein
VNLARAIGLAALLTNTTPALADASGYSTLEPAVAGPDVAITASLGNQILLRADGRLLALWQGTMSGIGASGPGFEPRTTRWSGYRSRASR